MPCSLFFIYWRVPWSAGPINAPFREKLPVQCSTTSASAGTIEDRSTLAKVWISRVRLERGFHRVKLPGSGAAVTGPGTATYSDAVTLTSIKSQTIKFQIFSSLERWLFDGNSSSAILEWNVVQFLVERSEEMFHEIQPILCFGTVTRDTNDLASKNRFLQQ